MTPGARVSAAIEVLDAWLAGMPAERALTNWARASRFAGSGDRAAVRDHVFQAIRCRRSYAALGGAETGRGLMIGALRAEEVDPASLFTGDGHAPRPLDNAETSGGQPYRAQSEGVRLDLPDWLADEMKASLGHDFAPVLQAMRHRAPVFLRVNRGLATVAAVQGELAAQGIETRPSTLANFALEVTENERKIRNSPTYLEGRVELQDAASQALVEALDLPDGGKVLDYCAGGGGKALALAARSGAAVFAHDVNPARMKDLPARAGRARARVSILDAAQVRRNAPYDLILADAPCSGSGSWRRAPEGKWRLTPERLDELCRIQAGILDEISGLTGPGERIAYATCSLLARENRDQVEAFLSRHPGRRVERELRLTPLDGGDGFYLAQLGRG